MGKAFRATFKIARNVLSSGDNQGAGLCPPMSTRPQCAAECQNADSFRPAVGANALGSLKPAK
jgi:hypothetical protein